MLLLKTNNSIWTMFLRLSHSNCFHTFLIESSWKHLTKHFKSNLLDNERLCSCTIKKNLYILNVMHCKNYTTEFNSYMEKHVEQEKDVETNLDLIKDKILFNSLLEADTMKYSWLKKKIMKEKAMRREFEESCEIHDFPIALKYLASVDLKQTSDISKEQQDTEIENQTVNLPYTIQYEESNLEEIDMNTTSKTLTEGNVSTETPLAEKCADEDDLRVNTTVGNKGKNSSHWMKDYEQFDDSKLGVEVEEKGFEQQWELNYGSPNTKVPISKVPCGGCGALLHCQDTAIPGYLPSELLLNRTKVELRGMTCQRCHFMQHYNMALSVNVPHGEYPHLLAQIKDKRALVILMVDVTDFPCSLWPGILDIIGTKRPMVVVGNKIDLLPQDSPGFLNHIKSSLRSGLERTGISAANIKHVALVSALTGFGVEELITKLQNAWQYEGDVFLLGCTNVGKSTLFNALLQSDYCKVKAVDLLQRATTSPWPGTTLNLLKFPIMRPSGWVLYMRTQRLLSQRDNRQAEAELRLLQLRTTKSAKHATLIGHIGRTFSPAEPVRSDCDPFSVSMAAQGGAMVPPRGLDPADADFVEGKWCYDTPGTVQPDQILDLLTTEELMLTIPKKLLVPRSFSVREGMTLFIGGLARLDYIEGHKPIRLTVFAAHTLPLMVCWTRDAEQLHGELAGSELTAVPRGDPPRLALWPGLSPHPDTIQVTGLDWRESCADVVLSSAGWVAVTPGNRMVCKFRAWTPESRGVHVRMPSFLRYSVNLRGARIRRSPAYRTGTAVYIKS